MSRSAADSWVSGIQFVIVALPWLGVVLGMAVATHSVVRYELPIVLTYSLLVMLLGGWLVAGRPRVELPANPLAGAIAAVLVLVAVLQIWVRPYTYLTTSQGWTVRWVFCATALLAAGLLVAAAYRRVPPLLVLAVAMVGYLVGAVLLIHGDPRPRIDVWITLQQAADGIANGQNIYALNWHDSPGVQDAFTYLPFTALLLAPGRWVAGDVRWMLLVVTLIGVIAVYLLRSRRDDANRIAAAGAAVLLLVMPGTPTQVEQAWTEPLLMACLAGWALGVQRRMPWLSIICLALGLASKQHLVLLLPMLAAWPRFGWRRTLRSALLAGAFVLPWFIASPADMLHDTVTVLVSFQPLRFADTLFIAAMHELGWTPPFWITGALVIAVVAASAVLVRRRNPDLGTVLRWAALVLFVANLVNKQAFYNQYWLVAALLTMSLACPGQAVLVKAARVKAARVPLPADAAAGSPDRPSATSAPPRRGHAGRTAAPARDR